MLRDITKANNRFFSVKTYSFQTHTGYIKRKDTNTIDIVFVKSGAIEAIVGGNMVSLKRNQLLLVDTEVSFCLLAKKPAELYCISVELKEMDMGNLSVMNIFDVFVHCHCFIEHFPKCDYLLLKDAASTEYLLDKLFSFLNHNQASHAEHFYTQVMLSELLIGINNDYHYINRSNPHVAKIINYMLENYQTELTIDDIAYAVNLNAAYMQTLFKKETDNSIFEYLNQYRVTKSIILLRNKNMLIEEIALNVGFASRQTFYTVFKKHTGYTPGKYKKFLASPLVSYNKAT